MMTTADVLHGAFAEVLADSAPWYLSNEVLGGVLGAVLVAVLTLFITRGSARSALGQRNTLLQKQVDDLQAKYDEATGRLGALGTESARLRTLAQKYQDVRQKLAESRVVRYYEQPVLLLGPRNVGKTSLLMQWHAPWDARRLASTTGHKQSLVPIYDVVTPDAVPHFADSSILTELHAHLRLRVHDFPGEPSMQSKVIEVAREETQRLLAETRKNLGVVLICMFNAAEAAVGIDDQSRDYYNAELFGQLHSLVSRQAVRIERLVVVFNKFDLLRAKLPDESAEVLLARCVMAYEELARPFRMICNTERICETVTVLDRDNLTMSQGATIVLGEAARGLVEAVAGASEADRWQGDNRASALLAATLRPVV